MLPRLTDDGRTVEIDLHGVRVDEALAWVRAVAAEAARRGRGTLRVVHGAPTSDPTTRNRTIRHALHDLLDSRGLGSAVTDSVRFEGYTLLSLAAGGRRDPAPLTLAAVRPPTSPY